LLRVGIRQVIRQHRKYLGVVISVALGTAGLILVVTTGRDVKGKLNQNLELLGGATRVKAYFERIPPEQDVIPKPPLFYPEAVEALRRVPGVDSVTLTSWKPAPAFSSMGKGRHRFTLVGVDEYFWTVNSFSAVQGKLFDPEEVRLRKPVCVLGVDLARKIFGDQNPVGQLVPIDHDLYLVTGVLGGVGLGDRTNFAFLPLTTALDRIQAMPRPDTLYLRCHSWNDVERVAAAIPEVVLRLQPAERLKVYVPWEQLERVKMTAWWVEFFVYVAVCATLTLGGFGIWNGMMTAVRARTREIGLKKAVGAQDADIMAQFLIESSFLSFGAGILGVGLGWLGVALVGGLTHSSPSDDLFLLCVGLSLVFAFLLGIAAGFVPSLLASRMEVVNALRYE
jgi:putative ABC transport system permease protein